MERIRIALIGYGSVGQAFAAMLERKRAYIEDSFGVSPQITALCTGSRGGIIDENGIDTAKVTASITGAGGGQPEASSGPTPGTAAPAQLFDKSIDSFAIIDSLCYDVLVELTPINIRTGQPAIDHIRSAMSRGKHVITANKGPIAWAYRELRDLAKEKGIQFFHEAVVMDGIPVFNLAKETLMGCRITEISGILNATTNFILTEMEKGTSYEDAVAEGQRQGFVEADPSMDVDGWDAAAKLTALMNVLMDVEITPMDIDRIGVGGITKQHLDDAKAKGKRIKLICRGWIEDGKPVGTVRPTLLDADHIASTMSGTESYVTITTDLMGGVTIKEEAFEPEIDHTAYGVLIDLLRILTEIRP